MSEIFWRRLLGVDGDIWLDVALLIGLLCVAIWYPQRVSRPALFRLACALFAISLLSAPIAEVFFRATILEMPDSGSDRSDRPLRAPLLVSSVIALAGRILFAVSLLCAIGSLEFRRRESADAGWADRRDG